MSRKTLAQCLEIFNRKERYWLIRNCCGNGADLSLPLSDAIIEKLTKKFTELLNADLKNAWWAMDYHIDWLIAALTRYNEQNEEKKTIQNINYKISGTQEDFDFIICTENTLIFVEAKLSSRWDRKQLDSKIKRLKGMKELFQSTKQYFVLLSPEFHDIESTKDYVSSELDFMRTGYICLETPPITDDSRFLKLIRCDENCTADKDGAYWKTSPCPGDNRKREFAHSRRLLSSRSGPRHVV